MKRLAFSALLFAATKSIQVAAIACSMAASVLVSPAAAMNIAWTDWSGWTVSADSGTVTTPDGKSVSVTISDVYVNRALSDGGVITSIARTTTPFFTEEHPLYANVNDIDLIRFWTRTGKYTGEAPFLYDATFGSPGVYKVSFDVDPPLDYTNLFMVGQLGGYTTVDVVAYYEDDSTLVDVGQLIYVDLEAEKDVYTFREPLLFDDSFDDSTGRLFNRGIWSSNSQYGFFTIPYGTRIGKLVFTVTQTGDYPGDVIDYGIGYVYPTELSPREGTIGTKIVIADSGFGMKKGKVLLGEIGTKIAKNDWSDSTITCTVTKVPPPGEAYDITILTQPYKTIIPGAFTVMNPEVDPLPVDYDHAAPGTEIIIAGRFFSTKKGKVYLEDPVSGKKKTCKVTNWQMDPTDGESTLTFVVPKLPKGFSYGVAYPLKITNKVGATQINFTVDPLGP